MSLTTNQKEKIREAALRYAERFDTRTRCANALEINVAQFATAIIGGKLEGEIFDAKWMDIARKLNVSLKDRQEWRIAQTKVVVYLCKQFEICQTNSTSGLFCDVADCGKTAAADYYVSTHVGAIRIDCSLYKSKRRLVNEIARQLGVPQKGNYWDVYDSLVWQINNSDNPLIILDEAGDLQYEAFLEIKGLWNATQGRCGWFMLGADALRAKIERGKLWERVGFHEIFSRFGAKYQSCIDKDTQGRKRDILTQAAMVAKLNAPQGMDIQKLVLGCEGSLRRVSDTIQKGETQNMEVR